MNRCKCCLRERSSKDLWSEHFYNGIAENYGQMLNDCFQLSWIENEMEQICHPCIGRLREAHDFKRQVLEAEQFLSRIDDGEFSEKTHLDQKVEDFLNSTPIARDPQFRELKNQTADYDDMESQVSFTEVEYLDIELDERIKEENETKTAVLIGDTVNQKVEDNTTKSPAAKSNINKKSNSTKISTEKDIQRLLSSQLSPEKVQRAVKENEDKTPKSNYKKKPLEENRNLQWQLEREKHQVNAVALLLSTNATPIHNKQDTGFLCGFCNRIYLVAVELKAHVTQDHTDQEKKKYLCERELYHLIFKLDITNLRCRHCDLSLKDLEAAWSHLPSHNIPIHTEIKNQIIPYKFHEGDLYKCFMCGLEFSGFRALTQHMHVHYQNYMCTQCGRGFLTKRVTQLHARIHENGTFQCSHCPKLFTVRLKWLTHEKNHIRDGPARVNKCGFCGDYFKDHGKKERHLETVHGVRRAMFECGACGKHLTSKKTLRNHIENVHLKMKRYQCPVCDKEFFEQSNVVRHLTNKHSKEKSVFQCELCPKLFHREVSYKLHVRAHDGDKHHICELCSETFLMKTGLKSHLRAKHGISDNQQSKLIFDEEDL